MAALITADAGEFAAALPDGGKLAGLDVGTKTIGLAICDAGWHFAGPAETIRRTKFTQDLDSAADVHRRARASSAWSSACRSTWTAATARGPNRCAPSPATSRRSSLPILLWDERWSTQAVERAMIEADVSRAQARREGRRARRRAYPAGRDRRAGQSARPAISQRARGPPFDRFADRRRRSRRSSTAPTAVSRTIATATASERARRPDRLQPLLRELDPHRDVVRDRRAPARRLGDLAVGRAFLGQEGRDAGGYGADAQRDATRCAGHPPPRERRAGRSCRDHGCAGDQRRRRHQRAPDPGTARCRDASVTGSAESEGLKVAICGDIRHSRVARSNAKLLPRLGAEVRLAGPPELMPDGMPAAVGRRSDRRRRRGDDAARPARAARRGIRATRRANISQRYGLTASGWRRAAPDAVVMHPGPMNRGVEIDRASRRRSRSGR